jgi:glycosyltransferase involved in cell wall biosynthesis
VIVGVLTTSYPREPGDPAGGFVAELARFVAARGHAVEVVAAGPGMDRDGDIRVDRVPGAGLFYGEGAPDRLERSPRARLAAPVFTAGLLAAAARRARRWDRIVAHWLVPSGLVGSLLGRTLAVAHSGDVHLAARPGLADAVAAALIRGRTVFVAEHLRARLLAAVRSARLRRALAERSLVCPMGVDTAALARARAGDRVAARRRLGLAPDRPVVAFLGRLVPIKGVDVLAAACPNEAQLVIAGAGPLHGRLLTTGARLVGELRGPARDDLFCAADMLVVPSIERAGRTEGAPQVLLEALAAGVPVVASDVPGLRALAGAAALYAPPGDAPALRAAVRAVLAGDTAARVRLGRERAAGLSWTSVGERLLHEIVAVPSRDR